MSESNGHLVQRIFFKFKKHNFNLSSQQLAELNQNIELKKLKSRLIKLKISNKQLRQKIRILDAFSSYDFSNIFFDKLDTYNRLNNIIFKLENIERKNSYLIQELQNQIDRKINELIRVISISDSD